jgi:hypothetical protein
MLEKLNMGVPTPLGLTVISLLAMLVGGLTISQYFDIKKEQTFTEELNFLHAKIQEKRLNWEVYKNEVLKIQLEYPKEIVSLFQEQNKIFLNHSVIFEHNDPCEFKGDGLKLKELTDFKVNLELFKGGLSEAVKKNESADFVSNHLLDKKFKLEPGFIDEIAIGSLNGYVVTEGVEGCGQYTYYFPLNSNNTLIVWRAFIPEFQPIVVDYQKNLQIPGIISPEKEETLFKQIFSTFKLID